ncbi:ATP-binding protein [Streptodolium elevatio]|uniref:ATP-binding protein n=1 Tax=Streptodolium elevatio TaxID=3157996 RepID=A0ABV3DTL5_9ACTN
MGTKERGVGGTCGSRPIAVSATYPCDDRISRARAATREFLVETAPVFPADARVSEDDADLAQLVVSELVTNAHKYAPGPSRLILTRTSDAVHVSVEDSSRDLPRPHGSDPMRSGQHGLEIVVAVCRSLDIRREPVGKRVTAVLGLAHCQAA